jgi:uncharacterized membrane protein
MNTALQIPSMWREELIHPLLAHFAVALVPLALLFRAGGLFTRWGFFRPASILLVALGTLAAWVAVYTGGLAEDVVNKVICDPTVTKTHEEFAEWTAILVSAVLGMDLAALKFSRFSRKLEWLSALVLVIASGLLMQTGHLGASLVYQQGAATYHPSEQCTEFQ